MKTTWNVKKMKCDGCVKTIAEALLLVDGLVDVEVDLNSKTVSFEAKDKMDVDAARKALQKSGYAPDEK